MIQKRYVLPPANLFLVLPRKYKELLYRIKQLKEFVKWNEECRQTKVNEL